MSEMDKLQEENRQLQRENEELKEKIEDLQKTVKDYSVVNGYLRRSNERKSRIRRRIW